MLSPKTIFRLLLSLVLIWTWAFGSDDLRIAVNTMCVWAFGHVFLCRYALPAGFRHAFHLFVFVTFWMLAFTNDVFYENVFGRFLDIFFSRPSFDLDTPGAGFTDWHITFRRRRAEDIALAWRFLRFAVLSTLGFVSLPFVVGFTHLVVREVGEAGDITRAIEYLDKHHEYPPWLLERQKREKVQVPEPKRDTRYVRWTDDIIFVCGPGGGFESVVAGDYDGAISRRRGISKEFA